MLNLFGAIARGLGHMLPGYVQGERMANQDNWNDLNQYNGVQNGQINNAWLEASFNPMYNQLLSNTAMTEMNAMNNGQQTALNMLAFPGRAQQAAFNSQNAGLMAQMRAQNELNNMGYNNAANQLNLGWLQQMQQMNPFQMWPQQQQQQQPAWPQPQQQQPNYENQMRPMPSSVG